jgi:hypothetical protein
VGCIRSFHFKWVSKPLNKIQICEASPADWILADMFD